MQILRSSGRAIWQRLRELHKNDDGSIVVPFALGAIVLMVAVGAGVDMARWLHARSQTLSALDSAVLAGARIYHTSHKDVDAGLDAARKFYNENVKSRLPVIDDTVEFAMRPDGRGITASGNAFIETPFLSFAGYGKLPLLSGVDAIAEFGSGKAEVSVMLDVTGSMAGSKLQSLKNAAEDMIQILLDANAETKVALVPFSEDIRLPTTSALNATRAPNLPTTSTSGGVCWGSFCFGGSTYYRSDCVVERVGNQRYTDAPPANNAYPLAKYTTQSTGSGNNRKGTCAVPENAAVQPLTNNLDLLRSKIRGLGASGGTAGHLGTAWAWYTLSPKWNFLWGPDNQAKQYDTDTRSPNFIRKIAVLMTDGEYNTQYEKMSSEPNGGIVANQNQTTSCPNATNGCSSVQAKELCKRMKQDAGIEIFTVVYGNDRLAIDVMQECASVNPKTGEKYAYVATDGEKLQQAFRDIGIEMTKLYLAK
jgi:hypothetical protein